MKQFGTFELDTANQCLWSSGQQVALAPKPFAVLCYLVDHPGRLITHNELMDALWPETFVQPQILRTYMLELRKVLGDDPGDPLYIQTLPKRGYCFVAQVTHPATGPARIERTQSARTSSSNSALLQPSPPIKSLPPSPPGIVGRTEEITRLRTLVDQAAGGTRQIVFITGEAGIGKSALVDALCLSLKTADTLQPTTIVRGQCVEGFGGREEYYPIMEALSELCASTDGDRACRILSRMAPHWLAALGREADAPRTTTQTRMPGDLCAALEELAAEHPLILILEDLHWADDATLHLLSALARRRAPARLMILAACQPPAKSAEHPLKALKQDLLMRRLATKIELAPFNRAAIRDLISRELKQQTPPPGLAGFVHQHSEGNPLFALAILDHLIAQKFLIRRDREGTTTWEQSVPFDEMEASVPDGLAQMIELEIERLTPEAQRLLEAASLIRVAFPAWAVAAAIDADPAETEEACDALARRLHFVERVGQDELPDGSRSAFYVFAHGLYREVLYQRQSAARRARRHTRVADRLTQLFAGRETSVAREVATHYEAAGQWLRAVQTLRNAAHNALQRSALAESEDLLTLALRIAENLGMDERTSVLAGLRAERIEVRAALDEASNSNQKLSAKV